MAFDYREWEMQFHATRESPATVGFRHHDLFTDVIVRAEHGDRLAVLRGVSLGSIAECAAYLTAFVEARGAGQMIADAMPEMREAVEKQARQGTKVEACATAEANAPEAPAEGGSDRDLAVSTLRDVAANASDPHVRMQAAGLLLSIGR